jgi:hypothetical protein
MFSVRNSSIIFLKLHSFNLLTTYSIEMMMSVDGQIQVRMHSDFDLAKTVANSINSNTYATISA